MIWSYWLLIDLDKLTVQSTYLSVVSFIPSTFKVIIDMIVLTLNWFGFVFLGPFFFSFFYSFLVIWWPSFVLCLGCFIFFLCVYLLCFWVFSSQEVLIHQSICIQVCFKLLVSSCKSCLVMLNSIRLCPCTEA